MGSLFDPPKAAAPLAAPPPAPMLPNAAAAANNQASAAAANMAAGMDGTLLTGPQGVTNEKTGGKALLGN